MSLFKYVFALFRISKHAFERGELMRSLVVAIFALIAAYLAAIGIHAKLPNIFEVWEWVVGLWVIFIFVLVAPFILWTEDQEKIKELSKELAPGIELSYKQESPWLCKLGSSNIPDPFKADYILDSPSWWYRVQIKNLSTSNIARQCQVFISDIEYSKEGLDYEESDFGGSLTLRWANESANPFGIKDISSAERIFVDILSVDPIYKEILIKWQDKWIAYKDIFKRTGFYRLTVGAKSENAGSSIIKLIVKWTGKWDEIDVQPTT